MGEVKEVADMHQRKAEMAKHADAFIAIPGRTSWLGTLSHLFFHHILMCFSIKFLIFLGGYGTMEELLEVITWSQLGIHDKPVR